MNDIKFKLEGLSCEACVKIASKRLSAVAGVSEVNIDLASGNTSVLSEEKIDLATLEKSLADTTYKIAK